MKTEHTPTPWFYDTSGINALVEIHTGGMNPTSIVPRCFGLSQRNAAFIVRACNNHERLVNALHNLTDLCEGRELFPQAVQNARTILEEINE